MSGQPIEGLFLSLSSAMTGFSEIDLQGTGLVGSYLETLNENAKDDTVHRLLSTWQEIEPLPQPARDAAIRQQILDDKELGPVVQSLTEMWYLGQWGNDVVSPLAYKQGLVWPAMNAHPMGAKQQGYGAWALPPHGGAEPRSKEERS